MVPASFPCPARNTAFRGFSGVRLIVVDEAARVPNDLYFSVRPDAGRLRRPSDRPLDAVRNPWLVVRRVDVERALGAL